MAVIKIKPNRKKLSAKKWRWHPVRESKETPDEPAVPTEKFEPSLPLIIKPEDRVVNFQIKPGNRLICVHKKRQEMLNSNCGK